MVPCEWGERRKKKSLYIKFYKKKFYLSTLLNSNKEKLAVNIDLISILLYFIQKLSSNLNLSRLG
jgi:hypothetical protein